MFFEHALNFDPETDSHLPELSIRQHGLLQKYKLGQDFFASAEYQAILAYTQATFGFVTATESREACINGCESPSLAGPNTGFVILLIVFEDTL